MAAARIDLDESERRPSMLANDPIAGATAFLHNVGAKFRKGERINVLGPLPDGSGELTVRYARFGDMLEVIEALEAMRAMAQEDQAARRRH
jgi:hypothetical protein